MIDNGMRWVLTGIIFSLFLVAIATSQPFRFTPTHSILKESYCHGCHGPELEDVFKGTHLPSMPFDYQNRFFNDYADNYYSDFSNTGKSDNQFLDSFCQTCHMNTLQFYRFELSDPYIFKNSGNNDSIYATINFFNQTMVNRTNDQLVTADLTLSTINPENTTVHATLAILLENFSYHQVNTTSFTASGTLQKGDHLTVNTTSIYPDYFFILLMVDNFGWNTSGFILTLNGTSDDGDHLFTIYAPGNYFLPSYISGDPYFHTRGYYNTARLDLSYTDFKKARVNNITALEGIQTTTRTGYPLTGNTCMSKDTMCHIVQKTTAMGSTIGFYGPDGMEGFYRHDMPYTTSSGNCLLCHLNGL